MDQAGVDAAPWIDFWGKASLFGGAEVRGLPTNRTNLDE